MLNAAWMVCKNHIIVIRRHHDYSRDMKEELPYIAEERYFSAYCFRGTKQLKHVSCRLPFQKCTKSVYCQHMSIYLLALRKWLLLIAFNQADACMPDLQIKCYHYCAPGRRNQCCNYSTVKRLSFTVTWQHLQTGIWDCSFFFQSSNAEIQAGLHWSHFRSLKSRAGESIPNWLSLSGRDCPKMFYI